MGKHTISFSNGIRFDLLTKGKAFLGIGKVWANRTALRSGRRPMFVEIRTPDGIVMTDYAATLVDATPDGLRAEFTMRAASAGIMEYMLHTVRNRYDTRDWTLPPEELPGTKLRLEVRPVTREIGARMFAGLSYQYFYSGAELSIFRILDRATWEVGGKAIGNEILMRNCFADCRTPIASIDQHYSTEWFLPSCENPNIFQFLPLQTELQGFTFASSAKGVLITWATEVAHVRSLIEKKRAVDEIEHWHEHCGDLAHDFRTAPVEVLFSPGKLDLTGRFNLYESMKELVHDTLHAQLGVPGTGGMRRERITTYGQIEQWLEPDFNRYRELGLPKLLEIGMRKIGLANHFENNMNTWGASNMCCTVDYKVAETVGEDKLREFCRAAQAAGAKVEMWGNTSVSTLTVIFNMRNGRQKRIDFLPKEGSIMEALKDAKEPWVRNPTRMIESDHYTPVFAVMNLRDPVVRDYWLKRWGYAHDSVGLEGIFLDSSFNLSSDKFHWVQNTMEGSQAGATSDQTELLGNHRPDVEPPARILSEYRAHLDLMTEMQKIGYDYCTEDLGVFGIHRHGPDVVKRIDTLPIWTECICNFDAPALEKAGLDPADVFFRGLAFRMMWSIHWDIKNDRLSFHYGSNRGEHDSPTAWHISLLRAFNEVNDLMRNREILPRDAGVIYRSDGKRVFWAFSDTKLPLDAVLPVRDVIAGTTATTDSLKAIRHHVYVIG